MVNAARYTAGEKNGGSIFQRERSQVFLMSRFVTIGGRTLRSFQPHIHTWG